MLKKIYDFINEFNMIAKCDRIVVGLSGGADSVCLLRVLHSIIEKDRLPVELVAVHINHGIRGEEAVRDQEFSRQLCEKLNIRYVEKSFDIPKIAVSEGASEEEAGRKVRYAVFNELAGNSGKIAVAHHMDDQAETVLMNLFRGSSIKGMGGMSPVRDNIIRPLLCVTRQEIEDYLRGLNQDYVTDSSNLSDDYTRNRIRNKLLPYIRENINQEVSKHVVQLSNQLRQCQEYIDKQVSGFVEAHIVKSEDGSRYFIDVANFVQADPVIRSGVVVSIFNELTLSNKDIYKCHIDVVAELAHMQVGRRVDLPYGMWAKKGYEAIEIGRGCISETKPPVCHADVSRSQLESGIVIPVDGKLYADGQLRYVSSVSFEVLEKENTFDKKNVYTKFFDYDKIKDNLVLRYKQDDDYIYVTSDGSKKKLKKEFVDKKVPGDMRDSVLLLANGSHVLWAMGVRRGENCLVCEDTKKVLKVCMKCQED